MFTAEDNIKVFKDSLHLSKAIFANQTREMMKNTKVVLQGSGLLWTKGDENQKVEVVKSDSISTILGVVSSHVGVLNFADAIVPGGLVWRGAFTQEECLCRCSNLYPSLSQDKCYTEYYNYNKSIKFNVYSNRLIYSPDVLVFKDANYNLIEPVKVDIITCPAPVRRNDYNIFVERIKCIIGSAYNSGVDTLVLGAWGCGAFGNNPEIVARAFKDVLDEYKLFDKVIFAIKCDDYNPSRNYEVFRRVMQDV